MVWWFLAAHDTDAIIICFSGNMAGDIYQNMYITTAGGPIQFILILVLYKGRRLLLFLNYFPTCLLFVVISILMFYTQFEGKLSYCSYSVHSKFLVKSFLQLACILNTNLQPAIVI